MIESQEARIAELMECLACFKELREGRKEGPAGIDLLTMLARDAATKDQPDTQFLGNLMLLNLFLAILLKFISENQTSDDDGAVDAEKS